MPSIPQNMKPLDAIQPNIQPKWKFDFEKIEKLATEIQQMKAEELKQ
jgi:hypothetical protein